MYHIYFVLVLIFRTGLACGFHISTSLASLIFFSDCISLTVVVVVGGLPFTCCKENKTMTLICYSLSTLHCLLYTCISHSWDTGIMVFFSKNVKQFGSRSVLLVLIWVQTVGKDYQQTSKVTASRA